MEIVDEKTNVDRKIKVIVMRSGKNNTVQKGLAMALKKNPDRFDVVYISLALAKQRGWSSEDFCEYAKTCDIFIFTCHPVQGDEPPLWDFREHLKRLYEVLKDKITFPDDPKALLEDAVFRQDKVQLYEMLSEYMTPTIIITRPQPSSTFEKSTIQRLHSFGKTNYEVHEKHGVGSWHIKGSFTTNSRGVTRAKRLVKAPRLMMAIFNRWGLHAVPDCLFQRTFANSVEMKILFLSDPSRGIFLKPYLVKNHKRGKGWSFSCPPHTRILEFAKMIRRVLEEKCSSMAHYPILRIDIFITQTGRLYVNEVEGIEALCEALGSPRMKIALDARVSKFMLDFWDYKLETFYGAVIKSI